MRSLVFRCFGLLQVLLLLRSDGKITIELFGGVIHTVIDLVAELDLLVGETHECLMDIGYVS